MNIPEFLVNQCLQCIRRIAVTIRNTCGITNAVICHIKEIASLCINLSRNLAITGMSHKFTGPGINYLRVWICHCWHNGNACIDQFNAIRNLWCRSGHFCKKLSNIAICKVALFSLEIMTLIPKYRTVSSVQTLCKQLSCEINDVVLVTLNASTLANDNGIAIICEFLHTAKHV